MKFQLCVRTPVCDRGQDRKSIAAFTVGLLRFSVRFFSL
jgi:hypothetical protein